MAPPTLLEGCPATPGLPPGQCLPLLQRCPSLAREVDALHTLARTGAIPIEDAERQLNTYLLVAGTGRPQLLLPITDAPHHSLLPDLGFLIHRVLARCPVPGSLGALLEQCIPCLRHASRVIVYSDAQDVHLNLALALLLGLYPGSTVKRPAFPTRAGLYTRVHRLLTAPREAQTRFCQDHPSLLLLACMEYVTRVVPLHMPAQAAFLLRKDPSTGLYFRRVPALCDDLRQGLDEDAGWGSIQQACAGLVERVSRLKKTGGPVVHKEPCMDAALLRLAGPHLSAYWDAPRLHNTGGTGASQDEFRLLGQSLGLHGALLAYIQQDVQVKPTRCTAHSSGL